MGQLRDHVATLGVAQDDCEEIPAPVDSVYNSSGDEAASIDANREFWLQINEPKSLPDTAPLELFRVRTQRNVDSHKLNRKLFAGAAAVSAVATAFGGKASLLGGLGLLLSVGGAAMGTIALNKDQQMLQRIENWQEAMVEQPFQDQGWNLAGNRANEEWEFARFSKS